MCLLKREMVSSEEGWSWQEGSTARKQRYFMIRNISAWFRWKTPWLRALRPTPFALLAGFSVRTIKSIKQRNGKSIRRVTIAYGPEGGLMIP